MTGGKSGFAALALALAVAGAPARAEVVGPAAVREALAVAEVQRRDERLAALAAAGRATDLAAELDRVESDRTLTPVAREWLLDRGLHGLARLVPDARAHATVARLSRRVPVVFTRIDPGHGERTTPLYDVGATARFVARAWQRAAARRDAAADLARGSTAPVARYAARAAQAPGDSVRAGIEDAFRGADLASLRAQRAPVAAALARGERVDGLALVAASRLADAELYRVLLAYADAPAALAAVGRITQDLPAAAALEELALASRRADVASAAVLAIGRLAGGSAAAGPARAFLLESLATPDLGPSAAAALGALADPGIAADIGGRLARSRSEPERRVLALALRLDGGAAARAELERFAASGKGSAELQRELRQWLRR